MLDVRSVRDSRETVDKALQPKMEICGLRKLYKVSGQKEPLVVLEEINFPIWPREFVCMVGASGCGKSTLLSIAAGLTLSLIHI